MSLRIRLSRSRPIRALSGFALRCWALSSIYIFGCIVLYWLYGGVFTFFLLCFATTGVLYHMEDELLYYPEIPRHSRVYVPSPSTCNLPYQSLFIRSKDGTMLHMFFIPQPEDKVKKAPTVLFLHGNAGNMGHRLQNVVGLYENLECNVLMLEYRGFGLSQGSPSEEGLYMDARAGIEYLATRSDINTNEIIVFGRSLGGAVAIDLTSKEEYAQRIWFLILENTFTSIPDMSTVLIGSKLRYLPQIFYKNKKIRSLTVPTFFISGLADKLVPPEMMTELYKSCKSSCKRMFPVPGGSHNETWRRPDYYQQILSFMHELREKPPVRSTSTHWQIDEI
ncbi:protein ABHD13 isoform X2 [Belonocnema kinseyi]|uniref:protein ABHD13 isoform X2 n=1 Tax=Belonocnema kinseyi TaxID=2817044 RepID=UPI00143CDEF4|nr:protein ABHD13 isoform X2 [Belonocnema kinseyi]